MNTRALEELFAKSSSRSAEIVDQIQWNAFDWLDAPIARVAGLDVPMPYATNLEDLVLPTVDRIVDAVRQVAYL